MSLDRPTYNQNTIRLAVEQQGLHGVMNNTRWKETINSLLTCEHHFEYECSYVDFGGNEDFGSRFDVREVLPEYYSQILHLDIHTLNYEHIGELVKPKHINKSHLAFPYLKKARYVVTDFGVRVYGYVKAGENVVFHNET